MDLYEQTRLLYERFGPPALADFRIEEIGRFTTEEAGAFTLADLDGKVVLMRRRPRADAPGIEVYWWIPGGAREPGERLDETALREFREETGLECRIERLLAARVGPDQTRFTFFFRGRVVGGALSAHGDPENMTAEARSFSPSDLPFGSLWSDMDKILLVREGVVDYPISDLLIRNRLREYP